MKTPYNLRVIKYLNGSVEISWNWDSEFTSDSQSFLVYATDTLGVEHLYTDTRNNTTIIAGNYISVRVRAADVLGYSDFSEVLPLVISNASDINARVIIGQDESGQARMLSVTPEGVLRVTGANITNTGGDASAANQLTQINLNNTQITKLNSAISELHAVLTKLDSVGLSAANIAALKSVSVTNQPSDYPDAANAILLQDIFNKIPSSVNLSILQTELDKKLNQSALSIDTDKDLGVKIKNLPSDYPNAALASKSDTANAELTNIKNLQIYSNNISSDSKIVLDNLLYNSAAELSILNSSLIAHTSSDVTLTSLLSLCSFINNACSQLNTSASNINLNTQGLLKSDMLNLDLAKDVGVKINNLPSDYPDAAANTKLTNMLNYLHLLTQGISAVITNALPAGSNLIGRVDVNSLPLPVDAAKDSSVLIVSNILNAIKALNEYANSLSTEMRNLLINIKAKLDNRLVSPELVISYNLILEANTNKGMFRLLDHVSDLTKLNKYNAYKIEILTYDNPGSIVINRESAINNKIYLHKICQKELMAADVFYYTHSMPIQNLSFSFEKLLSNASTHAFVINIYGVN